MFNAFIEQGPETGLDITHAEAAAMWWRQQQALRAMGQEYVWNDVLIDPSVFQRGIGGGNAAGITVYRGFPCLTFASGPNQRAYFLKQIPHGYYEATDGEAHIHYTIPTNPGADINIKFDIEMQWVSINAAIPAAYDQSLTVTKDVTGLENLHNYVDVGSVLGTGQTISSFIGGYIERDVSVANDYAGIVYLYDLDFHLRFDTTGSKQEATK